ncbi:hypothetical protein ABE10_11460 [Bacillus toyonensis]|nr:hypothetical protein [Bacillus toyonensis]
MKTTKLIPLALVLGLALTGCAANGTAPAPSPSESASSTPTPTSTAPIPTRVVPTFDMHDGGSISLTDLGEDAYEVDLQVTEGTAFEIADTSGFYFESYTGDAVREDGTVTVTPRDNVAVSTDLGFAWQSEGTPPEGAPYEVVFHLVFEGGDR